MEFCFSSLSEVLIVESLIAAFMQTGNLSIAATGLPLLIVL